MDIVIQSKDHIYLYCFKRETKFSTKRLLAYQKYILFIGCSIISKAVKLHDRKNRVTMHVHVI